MPEFERVIAIFHAAAACDPSERAALLDEQCGGDAVLRADVESLLAADASAGAFLDVPAAVATGLVPADDPPLLPGARVGSYVIEREIGRGGMGMVYLAEDERLGRKVAVKVLAPEFTRDRRRRDRLRQEARALAALTHPGIATVYALQEIDERLCLICEYVRGETLRAEIERGVPKPETVIDTGIQVAQALAAAHAAGVVHRDLKPENLMRDGAGRVRILDFGVAHIDPDARLSGQRLTEDGLPLGTPAYMSPEQMEGAEVDGRSDIFALGVLLYELASGRHPFETTTPASTAARILLAAPPNLRDINPAMPAGLEVIIRRCLEKAKADRFQSAAEVASELEALSSSVTAAAGQSAASRGPGAAGQDVGEVVATTGAAPPDGPARVRWWVFHQVVVMAIAALMVWPVALVHGAWGSDWTLALLLSVIATAAVNGTSRAHLLFLSAFSIEDVPAQLARTGPWLQRSDRLFAALLLLAAIPTARSHLVRSATLAAVGVGWFVASQVIEPATQGAAFPESNRP
jgi:eukaryotic-like serine/threonine-protein kinase